MTAVTRAPSVERRGAVRSVGDLAFLVGFVVCTTVALVLLTSGLAAALGASSGTQQALRDAAAGGGPLAALSRGVASAAADDVRAGQVVLDYAVSFINLGLGVLLVWLRPRLLTTRLLGIALVGTAAAFNLTSHAVFFAVADSGVNVTHFLLHAVSGVAYVHAVLVFPDGRLAAPWARRALAVVYGLAAVEILFMALAGVGEEGSGPLSIAALFVALPFQLDGGLMESGPLILNVPQVIAADAAFFGAFFGLVIPVLGIASQVQRYRTATSVEVRQQSRLLAWALVASLAAGIAFVVWLAVTAVAGIEGSDAMSSTTAESWIYRILPVLFAVVPLALFTGLLRYRLWDVDRVVNRALVYGLLTGTLGAVYVVGVVVIGQVARLITDGGAEGIAIGVATVVVALLFQPARRRIQNGIDRRFSRRRYDAAQALARFSARARDEVVLERLTDDLLGVVVDTMQPTSASLWLHAHGPESNATGAAAVGEGGR